METLKETKLRQTENEKFRNSNRKCRGKPHKQHTKDWKKPSGIYDKIQEMDILIKRNIVSKRNPGTKIPGNLGWKEQTSK